MARELLFLTLCVALSGFAKSAGGAQALSSTKSDIGQQTLYYGGDIVTMEGDEPT